MAASLWLICSSRREHLHHEFLPSVFLQETEIDSSERKHEGMKVLFLCSFSHLLTDSWTGNNAMNSNPCLLLTDPRDKKFESTAEEASTPLCCTCKDTFFRRKHFHSQVERYKVRSTSSQPFMSLLNPPSFRPYA